MSIAFDEMSHMNAALPEVTRSKLAAFRSRRIRLMATRGLGRCCLTATISLCLALLLDGWWAHPAAPWLACAVFYVPLLLMLSLLGQKVFARGTLSNEARKFERANRNLRGLLLPAVEMSDENGPTTAGSYAFIAKLQMQVEEAMELVDIEQMLPWRIVRRSLYFACAFACLILLLSVSPGLHFTHRAARILLPMFDWGRVSSVAIEIVRPVAQSMTVASGDLVSLVAKISGDFNGQAQLETRTDSSNQSSRMLHQPSAQDLNIGAERGVVYVQGLLSTQQPWIEYRVVAQQAQTPWYRLDTQPRPKIAEFITTIIPPAYTNLSAYREALSAVEIRALMGSRVQIQIQVEEPVVRAALYWSNTTDDPDPARDLKEEENAISELEFETATGLWALELPVDRDREFRVHLLNPHGLTNEFSRKYAIRGLTDVPPSVRWLAPTHTTLIANASDQVSLSLLVRDETSTRIGGQVRINKRDWVDIAVDSRSTTNEAIASEEEAIVASVTYDWTMDLLPFNLRAGDRMELRVSATDLKEQVTNSDVLEIVIADGSVDFGVDQAVQLRLQIAQRLEELATKLTNYAELGNDAPGLRREIVFSSEKDIKQLVGLVEQTASLSSDQLHKLQLGELGNALTSKMRQLIDAAGEVGSDSVAADAGNISAHFRTLVSYDVMQFLAAKLAIVFAQQSQLQSDMGADSSTLITLARRQQVIAMQLKEVQQCMLDEMVHLREESAERLRYAASVIATQMAQLEREQGKLSADLLVHNAASLHIALSVLDSVTQLDPGLPAASAYSQRELLRLAGAASESIGLLAGTADNLLHADNPRVAFVLEELAERRSIGRSQSSGQDHFASDLGYAKRAVEFCFEQRTAYLAGRMQRELGQIAAAIQVLDGVARLQRGRRLLAEIIEVQNLPQQNRQQVERILGLWDMYTAQIETAVQHLSMPGRQLASVPALLEALLGSERRELLVQLERSERSQPPINSLAATLRKLNELQTSAEQEVETLAQEARAVLAGFAPEIETLAERAAHATRNVGIQSQQLGEAVTRQEIPDLESREQQLEEQLSQLTKPIEDLREALVDHAELQDLLEPAQIAKARNADRALAVVADASAQIEGSLTPWDAQSPPGDQVRRLRYAAQEQMSAAEDLASVASILRGKTIANQDRSPLTANSSSLAGEPNRDQEPQLSDEAPADSTEEGLSADYTLAEQLAELAASDPEQLLEMLEKKLPNDAEMQQELSDIAKVAVRDALNELLVAQDEQQSLAPALEDSAPETKYYKKLLQQDIRLARERYDALLGPLLTEMEWTAKAVGQTERATTILQEIASLAHDFTDAVEVMPDTFSGRWQLASTLWNQLSNTRRMLTDQLGKFAASTEIAPQRSQPEIQLSRRELKDRARRVQQALVREARRIESILAESIQQAESQQRLSPSQLDRLKTETDFTQERQTQLATSTALQAFLRQLQQRRTDAREHTQNLNQWQVDALETANPFGRLGVQLAEQAVEVTKWIENGLQQPPQISMQATASAVASAQLDQEEVASHVARASDLLARAARHEERLRQSNNAQRLERAHLETQRVIEDSIPKATETLVLAGEQAAASNTMRVSVEASRDAMERLTDVLSSIEDVTRQVRQLLEGNSPQTQIAPAANATESPNELPLDSRELAQLLDALDQQLNQPKEPKQGPKDNDANGTTSSQGEGSPAPPIAEAAEQLAHRMSQNRQPASDPATSDLGMATDSPATEVKPQPAVHVQIVDVNRLGREWGELREQAPTELFQGRRDAMPASYRAQIEAYFRELGRHQLASPSTTENP
ncbi:MAG: hypothetical protein KDB22_02175 [Planctomycetales bacterium]|nr:hypothetical protein [Planctomycetales bacterium]